MQNEGKESQAQEIEDYKVFNLTVTDKARSKMPMVKNVEAWRYNPYLGGSS